MGDRLRLWVFVATTAFVASCGSVGSTRDGGATGSGGSGSGGSGGATGAGGAGGGTDGGGSGGSTGTGGTTGTGGAAPDAAAGGSGGAAPDGGGTGGAGGASADGGSGDVAAACTGAGICGRGPTGVYCAQSNGATALTGWKAWTPKFSDADGWKASPSYWATIQFPDVSGDGKADACGRGIAGISCGLSTGDGFAEHTLWSSQYSDAGGWNGLPSYWATIQFPDVNGDGKADVCGRASDGVYCAVSTGVNGFGPASRWTDAYANASGWADYQSYWGTLQFPDLNGDGKADVCARAGAGIYCGLSNGTNGFSAPTYWQAEFNNAAGYLSTPAYWGTIQFPDITGDGKADMCARGVAGVLCAISNGTNGFGPASNWSATYSDANGWNAGQNLWGTIQYPDVNGDGKADVCGRNATGVVCGVSSGTAFGATATWAAAFSNAAGFGGDATRWATIQYPDLDGDGKSDVCGRAATGVMCGLSSGTAFAVTMWLDQYSDVNGWQTDLSYGASLQTPNLNVTGCRAVTKKSVYSQPLSHRLAPF